MKEYFSHDYGAREDEKIKRLLYAHGWAGYGLYWAVVEMLYINDGYMLTEYERIAFDLRTEAGIIESIICDFDLFKFKKNKFYSVSALERLEQRKIKSDKARQSASARWNKANAMRPHSDSNAIKVKESKVKESKEKKKPKKKFNKPTIEDVRNYFDENGYFPDRGEFAWNYYNDADWHDSKGNPVLNWKQKMRAVWFKEENKKPGHRLAL